MKRIITAAVTAAAVGLCGAAAQAVAKRVKGFEVLAGSLPAPRSA